MDDIHYNQYDCISKSIVKRLNHEIGCKFPYHAFNKVLEEKTMCSNFSEYEGNVMMCFNFTRQIELGDLNDFSILFCNGRYFRTRDNIKLKLQT